jgi:hypothetical protein
MRSVALSLAGETGNGARMAPALVQVQQSAGEAPDEFSSGQFL